MVTVMDAVGGSASGWPSARPLPAPLWRAEEPGSAPQSEASAEQAVQKDHQAAARGPNFPRQMSAVDFRRG